MIRYHGSCKYNQINVDMKGEHDLGCVHPERKTLGEDGLFERLLLKIFPKTQIKRECAACWGYEKYCPLFEERPIPPPQRPRPTFGCPGYSDEDDELD